MARTIASATLMHFVEKNDREQKALVSEILTESISEKDAFQKKCLLKSYKHCLE